MWPGDSAGAQALDLSLELPTGLNPDAAIWATLLSLPNLAEIFLFYKMWVIIATSQLIVRIQSLQLHVYYVLYKVFTK